jgi:hypothetical protein
MRVELSWISLDSLVRIQTFQWVVWLEAGKIFSRAFSLAFEAAGTGASILACGRARLFKGMLNLVSDFLQEVVVRAIPFRTLNPKAARSNASANEPPTEVDIENDAAWVRRWHRRTLRG